MSQSNVALLSEANEYAFIIDRIRSNNMRLAFRSDIYKITSASFEFPLSNSTTRISSISHAPLQPKRTDEPIDHWLPYQNPGPHLPSRTGPRRINNDNEPLSNAHDEDDSERSSSRRKVQMTRRTEIRSRPVRSLAVGSVSQPPPPPPPKLVQWSKEPVQYYEGSTLVLSCSSASASSANAPLRFNWLKSGKSLMQATGSAGNTHERLSIETLAEYSFLRLASLRPSDGGQYTCVASNSLGQEDRTSAQVIVNGKFTRAAPGQRQLGLEAINLIELIQISLSLSLSRAVKLKWLAKSVGVAAQTDSMQNERLNSSSARFQVMPNGNELHVARAGSSLVLECNASAQPRPRIRWFRWAPLGGASNGQSVAAHTQTAHSGSTIRQQQLSPSSSSSSTTTTNRQQLAHLGNVKLDEAQLRAALMQPTTTNSNANSNNNNYDDTDSMVAQLQMQTQLHRAELAPIGMTPNSASSSSLSLGKCAPPPEGCSFRLARA